MCGITVIVNTKNAPVAERLVRGMNARIRHRGPDNEDIYHGDNFALGHRRLSIVDTGHLAHQPLRYGDYIITFNGEIYNHGQLRQKLLSKGYVFNTRSDTEVILAAYDYWKTDCVRLFEGMWSFVIYDIRKNILFGSRDRFGQKPFHYTKAGNYFMIGSEVKQFYEVPGFRPVLNQEAAFNFLNYNALNYSDETFFEGVRSLPAGHNMVYNLSTNKYSISQWYNFPRGSTCSMDLCEAAEQFRELFAQSVSLRLNSDVKFGSCLSGGLDSSSIVCMMDRILNDHDKFNTISICWNEKDIDEQEYIDAVTAHTNSFNKKVFPSMEELSWEGTFDKIVYHQDQPVPTASHFSEYKVYEAAAQNGLPVMLDGKGADEYLGGYSIFNWYHIDSLLRRGNLVSFSQEWNVLRKTLHLSDYSMIKNFLYIKYKNWRPRLDPLMNAHWSSQLLNLNPALPERHARMNIKDLSYYQLFRSSLPYQLHSADRNSMCHSVEARLPFLDHRLVEFSYTLPDSCKISKGMSKIILREALENILPRKIRERKTKLGFPAPELKWMKRNHRWIAETIGESAGILEKFITREKLQAALELFSKGSLTDQSFLFRVLSFASWLRIFNVSFGQLTVERLRLQAIK